MISDEDTKQFIDKETDNWIKPIRVPDINIAESNKDVILYGSFSHCYDDMVKTFGEPCFKLDKPTKRKPSRKWNLKFADETIVVLYTRESPTDNIFCPFWYYKTLKVRTKHSYCSPKELLDMYLNR